MMSNETLIIQESQMFGVIENDTTRKISRTIKRCLELGFEAHRVRFLAEPYRSRRLAEIRNEYKYLINIPIKEVSK